MENGKKKRREGGTQWDHTHFLEERRPSGEERREEKSEKIKERKI